MVEVTSGSKVAPPSLKPCLLQPILKIFDAARYLDAAVSAHLAGRTVIAAGLIRLADVPEITAWSEALWGGGRPWTRPLPVEQPEPFVPKDQRVGRRRFTNEEEAGLIARDGRHCRFYGIPLVRAEVRKALHRAYPEAARWGDRNADQHAGLQAMWLQFDRILPHARGGTNDPGNMLVTCAPCNNGRSNLTLAEAGLTDPRSRPSIGSTWDGLERFRA